MNPDQYRELYANYFYYILAADIAIGLLFGLVPLIFAIRRKRRGLGIIALVASGVIGAFSPVLSLAAAAVFTFIVFRSPAAVVEVPEASANDDTAASETHPS